MSRKRTPDFATMRHLGFFLAFAFGVLPQSRCKLVFPKRRYILALPQRRTVPDGRVSGSRNRRHLTLLVRMGRFGHARCRTTGNRSRLRQRAQQGIQHPCAPAAPPLPGLRATLTPDLRTAPASTQPKRTPLDALVRIRMDSAS